MSKLKDIYYNFQNFFLNLKWMIPAAWKFRCWDSTYNIELFCKSLEITANTIKIHGNALNKEKYYRRCITAAGLLRQAYNYHRALDPSLKSLMKNNPMNYLRSNKGYSIAVHTYKTSEEYYTKQFKLISKRLDKKEKDLKTNAWNYINKYIDQFWD